MKSLGIQFQSGRIPDHVLQTIRDRILLSRLISATVRLRREHREHRGRCPFHEDKTPSFCVNDMKQSYYCFGCGAYGDVFDFVRKIYRKPFREAVEAVACEAGIAALAESYPESLTAATLKKSAEDRRNCVERDRARNVAAALRILRESKSAAGTIVERYLRGRGFTSPIPCGLRYHSKARYRMSGGTWIFLPAMIAPVYDRFGKVISIHRTYLKQDGSGKAEVSQSKQLLGSSTGGAVRLGTGKHLGVAEGIETALSVQLLHSLPTWAALSTSGMIGLDLPPLSIAHEVTIFADNDLNRAGLIAAEKAMERWRAQGRKVRIKLPSQSGQDFNDVLRAKISGSAQ